MATDPLDSDGAPFCWDFNSKLGRFRGHGCPNVHSMFKNKNLHCAISAELARRGGRRRDKQNAPSDKDDVEVDQLRAHNQRKLGEQIKESKSVGRIGHPENIKSPSESNAKRERPTTLIN